MSEPNDVRGRPAGRAPLDPDEVRDEVAAATTGRWTDVRVVASTGSTNADVAELARAGAAAGSVVVADEQTAGRGRLDRSWSTPSGAALAVSVLLRPPVPQPDWPWLPLLAGLATARALRRVAGVDAALKWPNDVLAADGRKLAGLLAEVVASGAVALGIGINVSLTKQELPVPTATSLLLAGADPAGLHRPRLVGAVLGELDDLLTRFERAGGDADASGQREDYRAACSTLGRRVTVNQQSRTLDGTAVDVDRGGRLVLRRPDGSVEAVGAGDVLHVR